MGHLVHAKFFRLGFTQKWISAYVEKTFLYRKYLQEDLIIFRFINLFFKAYSIPVFSADENRTIRDQKNNKISGSR